MDISGRIFTLQVEQLSDDAIRNAVLNSCINAENELFKELRRKMLADGRILVFQQLLTAAFQDLL